MIDSLLRVENVLQIPGIILAVVAAQAWHDTYGQPFLRGRRLLGLLPIGVVAWYGPALMLHGEASRLVAAGVAALLTACAGAFVALVAWHGRNGNVFLAGMGLLGCVLVIAWFSSEPLANVPVVAVGYPLLRWRLSGGKRRHWCGRGCPCGGWPL
jgi:hypothetical protein